MPLHPDALNPSTKIDGPVWELWYWRNEGGEENYHEQRYFRSVEDALAHAAVEATGRMMDPAWAHFYLERIDGRIRRASSVNPHQDNASSTPR